MVASWLRDSIPALKKGRPRIYQKPELQTVEAVAGLATFLKWIDETENLDKYGVLEIAYTIKKKKLLIVGGSPTTHRK
jgi:hypothetical protein